MKMHHRPHHWIAVALAVAALLFTLSDAHGQSTGGAAVFEGDVATKDVKPGRDQSLAKDQRSVKKAKRTAKRTISRGRHGVSPIDSTAP